MINNNTENVFSYNGKNIYYFFSSKIESPKKLIFIFSPYGVINKSSTFNHPSGYKTYDETTNDAYIYIRDNFGKNGGFNLLEDGTSYPEEITKLLIKYLKEYFNILDEDILLFGERKGGFSSFYFGMKYNYQFVSFDPTLNLEELFNHKNISARKLMFGNKSTNHLKVSLLNQNSKKKGIIFFSHYSLPAESYEKDIFEYINQQQNIELKLFENFFLANTIKQNFDSIVEKYIPSIFESFNKDMLFENFTFLQINNKSFNQEKVFHSVVEGKNQVVKYWETLKNSNFLIYAFNPMKTLEENHDTKTGYSYKFLSNLNINIVNIRDAYAINGGWYIWDNGNTYPEKTMSIFLEEKRKELGIPKENVILFGSSKGGFSALYFAQKLQYKYVFSIAPILDPTILLTHKISSVLGLKVIKDEPLNETISRVQEKINTITNLIHSPSPIQGTIWYSDYDKKDGTTISNNFILNHPNIIFKKLEDTNSLNVDEIEHGKIAELFLPDIIKELKSFEK